MRLKWRRHKDGDYTFWTAYRRGEYQIKRWYAHDDCGHHRQYAVYLDSKCLHGQEPIIDYGCGSALKKAKRIAEDHAHKSDIRLMRAMQGGSIHCGSPGTMIDI